MQVKVINEKSEYYGKIFKVRRMNFDKIIVNYPNESGIKSFDFMDVEHISENEIDDFLIKNRYFLKIKLKRGISVVFYNVLYDSLKFEIKEEIERLDVLKDKYKINKKGIWEKEILLFVNNKFPLEVIASGKNFQRSGYYMVVNEISKENFLEICYREVRNIESDIRLKESALGSITRVVNQFESIHKIPEEMLL